MNTTLTKENIMQFCTLRWQRLNIKRVAHYDNKQHILTAIGADVFNGNEAIPDLEIEDGIAEIQDRAFANCRNLLYARIPHSVQKLGVEVFANCTRLTYLRLPDHLLEIPEKAFRDCKNLKSVDLPRTLRFVAPDAFESSGLEYVFAAPEVWERVKNSFDKSVQFKPI